MALDDPDMTGAMRALAAHGIQSVILEGGTAVHQAAWDAGVVDYVQLYVAPIAVGEQGPPAARGLATAIPSLIEQNIRMLGPDVLIEGYVHRPH